MVKTYHIFSAFFLGVGAVYFEIVSSPMSAFATPPTYTRRLSSPIFAIWYLKGYWPKELPLQKVAGDIV